MRELELRPYNGETDREELWRLKRAFETDLGSGDDVKSERYAEKLTADYRKRWLAWVDRCIVEDDRCVTLAVSGDEAVGYVFLLPERLAFVWDAAVVNELYVVPERRGTGVADDLLETATAVARDQALPLDRLLLDVDPNNGRAYAFYRKHGFEPWGEIVAKEL